MQDHIVKSFDIEITQLKESITAMAKKCENQLEKAVQALKIMDNDLALKVVNNDTEVNELQRQIEEKAISFLARRQPMAVDLRQLLGVMKIASKLERIGDYAANVAKGIPKLSKTPSQAPKDLIISMANTGRIMLHDSVMSFLMLDIDKAVEVWERDDKIDKDYITMMTLLHQDMKNKTSRMEDCTQLIFMGRCCERIGDHITNIAEDIYFIISGKKFLGQFEV